MNFFLIRAREDSIFFNLVTRDSESLLLLDYYKSLWQTPQPMGCRLTCPRTDQWELRWFFDAGHEKDGKKKWKGLGPFLDARAGPKATDYLLRNLLGFFVTFYKRNSLTLPLSYLQCSTIEICTPDEMGNEKSLRKRKNAYAIPTVWRCDISLHY